MKVLFISGPAPAKFNYREPNAYPFYLIREIASRHETAVLYFNANEKINTTDTDAGLKAAGVVSSRHIKANRLMHMLFRLLYLPRAIILRLFVRLGWRTPRFLIPLPRSVYNKYPDSSFTKTVKEFAPDLVVAFPMQLYFAVRKVTEMNIPVSILCTDSLALHFSRLLNVIDRIPASPLVSKQMLEQAEKIESAYRKINARYFFVGKEDRNSWCRYNGQHDRSFFIPHHLYSGMPEQRSWDEPGAPLNVLFGGDGHTIYVGDEADRIAEQIVLAKKLRPQEVVFYFLGTGYDKAIARLQQGGYTVISQAWAEDYDEYIKKMHVQVFPIILGTGTKAKVLSAMISGLLCVGTWFAFENICLDTEDYLLYSSPEEIPGILATVCNNKTRYGQIADATSQKILREHSTSKVVDMILDKSIG